MLACDAPIYIYIVPFHQKWLSAAIVSHQNIPLFGHYAKIIITTHSNHLQEVENLVVYVYSMMHAPESLPTQSRSKTSMVDDMTYLFCILRASSSFSFSFFYLKIHLSIIKFYIFVKIIRQFRYI